MSDAATTRFSVVKSSVAGTVNNNPAWLNLNTTGPGGGSELETIESQTLDPDRNPPGAKVVGRKTSLQLPFETQYDSTGAFWQLLLASMQAGTATAATTEFTTAASTTPTAGVMPLTGTAIETGIASGDFVRIKTSGGTLVGYFRVFSTTTNAIGVFDPEDEIPHSTSNLKVIRGKRIRNSVTQDAFSMIRANFAPGTSSYNRFELFPWETVDAINIQVTSRGFITGTLTTRGVRDDGFTTSDPSPGTPTYTAAPSTEKLDGTNNVPKVVIGGVVFGVQSVNFGWRNNSETRDQVGTFDATGIRSGIFRGDGTISIYYDDIVELNNALEGTPSQLYVIFTDSAGNAYAFGFPRIRYGNPTMSGQQQGGSIVWNLPFTLEKGTVADGELYGVHVEAFDA